MNQEIKDKLDYISNNITLNMTGFERPYLYEDKDTGTLYKLPTDILSVNEEKYGLIPVFVVKTNDSGITTEKTTLDKLEIKKLKTVEPLFNSDVD